MDELFRWIWKNNVFIVIISLIAPNNAASRKAFAAAVCHPSLSNSRHCEVCQYISLTTIITVL